MHASLRSRAKYPLETIEPLHRGFADVSAGRTTLPRVALNRLGRKHGIPR